LIARSRSGTPASSRERKTFSKAVRVGSRLKNWKTNPRRRRQTRTACFSEKMKVLPVHFYAAPRGLVEPCDEVEEGCFAGSALSQ